MNFRKASQGLFLSVGIFLCYFNLVMGVSVEKDLSLTLSEKRALDKFREKVNPLLTKPHMKQDIYLIRWLRARDFNVQSAEALLRQDTKWRAEQNMDNILNEDWNDMIRDYPATIDTYDMEGRPIGVIDIYDWDIRRIALQGKGQRLMRYMNFLMESITTQVFERQAKGMNVTQWKVLGNADGFNLIEHGCPLCIPLWIQFIQNLENHYTGWLDEMILIDAPATINVILEAIKPFLRRQTRDTFRIFSPNKRKWMAYLDERISKEERRPQYGGTKPQPQKYTG